MIIKLAAFQQQSSNSEDKESRTVAMFKKNLELLDEQLRKIIDCKNTQNQRQRTKKQKKQYQKLLENFFKIFKIFSQNFKARFQTNLDDCFRKREERNTWIRIQNLIMKILNDFQLAILKEGKIRKKERKKERIRMKCIFYIQLKIIYLFQYYQQMLLNSIRSKVSNKQKSSFNQDQVNTKIFVGGVYCYRNYYDQALAQINQQFKNWSNFMIHKNIQRLTKLKQIFIRIRKKRLKGQQNQVEDGEEERIIRIWREDYSDKELIFDPTDVSFCDNILIGSNNIKCQYQ